MNKKYAIIIGILAIFLISSSYALLTNDNADSTTKNANNITKDTNITVDKSVGVDNSSVDKSVAADKSIDLDSRIDSANICSNTVSDNPPADRIYRENGTLFFEGYDGNGNRFFSEIPDSPNQHYIPGDDFVNQDTPEVKLDPADDPVMKNKRGFYSGIPFTPETIVYV